jgi:plasmid stability protein
MKSITMHNLDPAVACELEKRDRAGGRSLNRTAQELLRMALGLQGTPAIDRTEAFRDLYGTWKEEELREFKARIAEFERIDPTWIHFWLSPASKGNATDTLRPFRDSR